MTISTDYKRPLVRTAVAQGIVLLLGGVCLDGGHFLLTAVMATAAYWAALLIIVIRHPASPSRGDLIWASSGFAIALALAFVIGPLVVYLKGQL